MNPKPKKHIFSPVFDVPEDLLPIYAMQLATEKAAQAHIDEVERCILEVGMRGGGKVLEKRPYMGVVLLDVPDLRPWVYYG